MKNQNILRGLSLLFFVSLLGTQACGKKAQTTGAEVIPVTNASPSPRTDNYVDNNSNSNNNSGDWQTVDDTIVYPQPDYNQIYTPTCSLSAMGTTLQKLQDFFFLNFSGSTGSLKYCLSLPSLNPVRATFRVEYQHSYSQYPNTLFVTRYTTKTQYLLDPSYVSGSLKLMWMNQDGFIFVRANATVSGGDTFSGDLRYTNMPSSATADMASDQEEADCLSGVTSASTCARSFVLHRTFFAKLSDPSVDAAAKARIRQVVDYYYLNSYSSDFNSLGIYSTQLANSMSFSLSAAQAKVLSE